jgi:hypothetical protein
MNQLLNPFERQERIREKRSIILKFLRDETYSHIDIIKKLINVTTVQAAHQTLNKMVRDNLIIKAQINLSYGRPITLYGITNNGLSYAFDLSENLEKRPTFQPSKVKPIMLNHKLAVQKIIVSAAANGYSNVKNADLLNFRRSECKVPDLIAEYKGKTVGLEIELTFKSLKRITEIILSHLLSIKAERWHEVHYLVPSQDFKSRLERLFKSIKSVEYKGQKIHLNEKHFNKFKFYIIENSK